MNVDNADYHPSCVGRVFATDFRNYESLNIDLDGGFNIVSGPNAQGKTSLLEAVHFVATTRLLRTSRDSEAIRHEADRMSVGIELNQSKTLLEIHLERGSRKKATLNGTSLRRPADLLGRVPVTSISSLDLVLARGEPAARRQFLDMELSQLYPGYLNAFSHFKRALEQRNALLKSEIPPSPEALEPWDLTLAEHGAAMRSYRTEYLQSLANLTAIVHPLLADAETLTVRYTPSDPSMSADELLEALSASRRVDLARGTTTIGPHRDDVALLVNETDVRAFGSQGQQRTCVISLKLGSLLFAKELLKVPPLLLLDDILSDLDEFRRASLTQWVIQEAGQALLTCTEPEAAGKELLGRARIFEVRSGQITRR